MMMALSALGKRFWWHFSVCDVMEYGVEGLLDPVFVCLSLPQTSDEGLLKFLRCLSVSKRL